MPQTDRPETFRAWMEEELEPDTIRDLANHGAEGGFPGLTYYSDTVALAERFEDEIWDALAEDADSLGYDHPLALIATFGGAANVQSATQFQNLLTWYMAERIAREITDAETV